MHSHSDYDKPHRVPLARFFILTGAQLVLAFLAFRWLAPAAFAQEASKPGMILLWTFLFGLPISLFEYFYHRYLLHSAVLPFLRSMHSAHSEHHRLTAVKAPVQPKEPEKLVPVKNEYPIVHEHQEESMMFPFYSISIFFGIFLVLLALPVKLLFPGQPIVSAVLAATTLHYCGYELWHAVLHLPYETFWKRHMENPRYGRVVRYVYSFHLMHHWRIDSNLAVVGFWGVAIWDHLFRTHHRPHNMPLRGSEVAYVDMELKPVQWPVGILDRWKLGLNRWSRRVEEATARLFLRRRTPGR